MHDKTIGERTVLDLSHSANVYQTTYRIPFGYLWSHPAVAWGALRGVIPWEALGISLLTFVVALARLGPDLGIATGAAVTLALVVAQMLRTRSYVTTSRIVRQRGLVPLRWTVIPLSDVLDGRVEYPVPGTSYFGDLVIATPAGDQRFRAVTEPESALKQMLALRTPSSTSKRFVTSGRTTR